MQLLLLVMNTLRTKREALGLSQSQLARLAGVSRVKICWHELGSQELNQGEVSRIDGALRNEMSRIRESLTQLETALAS